MLTPKKINAIVAPLYIKNFYPSSHIIIPPTFFSILSIFIFFCRLVMSRTSLLIGRTITYSFLIKIYFTPTIIKIGQYYPIWYTSQCSKNMSIKIIQGIIAIFSNLFFSITPKMLNIIKFAMVFKIIYY